MKFKTLLLTTLITLAPMKTNAREDEEILDIKFDKQNNIFDQFLYNFEYETNKSVQRHRRYHNIKDRAWLYEQDQFWGRENTFQTHYILEQEYGLLNPHNDSLNMLTRDLNDALYDTLKETQFSTIISTYENITRFNFDFENKEKLEDEDDEFESQRKARSFLTFSGGIGIGTPSFAKSDLELDQLLNPYAKGSAFNGLLRGTISTKGSFSLSTRLYFDDILDLPKPLKRSYISYSFSSNFNSIENNKHQIKLRVNQINFNYSFGENRNDYFTVSWSFLW